jgi:tetratricopeptide (TPR) repeat protein
VAGYARQEEDENARRLLKLRFWAADVRDHQPGKFDRPAALVDDWPPGDLQAVVTDLKALTRFLISAATSGQKPDRPPTVSCLGRVFTPPDVRELLGLTDDEVSRGDVNRLLKRGALLHADIAMLAPPDNRHGFKPSPLASQGVVYLYLDGRLQGIEFAGVHWAIGRALLDEVRPDPSLDETVRLWYRAMGAYLQTTHAYAYADPLLDDARRIFPGDAAIRLYSGSVHESYAAPHVQGWARPGSVGTPAIAVRSRRQELQQAQAFFSQALKIDPGLTEARIRLGRVLELLGRNQEAATQLRRAATEADSAAFRYYADLFLGQAEQALGGRDAAREAFERAAALFPRAQSARLALSQLARRSGDRANALGAIQQVLSLPGDELNRPDPWWAYLDTHVPDANTLLDQLRKSFYSETAP